MIEKRERNPQTRLAVEDMKKFRAVAKRYLKREATETKNGNNTD